MAPKKTKSKDIPPKAAPKSDRALLEAMIRRMDITLEGIDLTQELNRGEMLAYITADTFRQFLLAVLNAEKAGKL